LHQLVQHNTLRGRRERETKSDFGGGDVMMKKYGFEIK
jgi:hypothetical protein